MTALLVIPVALIVFNVLASIVLFATPRYDKSQKRLQLAIIWLLPAVGAILVWSLARDTASPRTTIDFRNYNGIDDGDIRLDSYSSSDGSIGDSGGSDGGGGD